MKLKNYIKLIIIDVDGVMTDGSKLYDNNGQTILKSFNDKDWTAIKRFKALGIKIMFLSGDQFNVGIAKNRNVDIIINRNEVGHIDKVEFLKDICNQYNVNINDIAYIGDDLFDFNIMKSVKYKYCPKDAIPEIKKISKVLKNLGGSNLLVELFDVLKKQNLLPNYNFDEHLQSVYDLDEKDKF